MHDGDEIDIWFLWLYGWWGKQVVANPPTVLRKIVEARLAEEKWKGRHLLRSRKLKRCGKRPMDTTITLSNIPEVPNDKSNKIIIELKACSDLVRKGAAILSVVVRKFLELILQYN